MSAWDYWVDQVEIEELARREGRARFEAQRKPSANQGVVCPSCGRRHYFVRDCGSKAKGVAA